MPRTDDDTWDLASSVGVTATMVAAARAVATRAEDPIIDDPFAAPLVRAVGVEFFTKIVDGTADFDRLDSDEGIGMSRFANGMAARTRFFDDFFISAGDAGITQAVILASGLDSRAYRLSWPTGTVVYEIDQPEVMAFKTETIAELGTAPTAELRVVPIDLREDWPSALTAAGFDPTTPTAWIAEGLFGYLPPEAQDRLLDSITALSAPGSRLGVEAVPARLGVDEAAVRDRTKAVSQRWQQLGLELDLMDLIYLGDRADAATYLQEHGWQTGAQSSNDLLARNGLPTIPVDPDSDDAAFGDVSYLTALR